MAIVAPEGGGEGSRGIRAALEALEGRAAGGGGGLGVSVSGDDGGIRGRGGGEEGGQGVGGEGEGGGGTDKVARLEGEIERLRTENLRWQKVGDGKLVKSRGLFIRYI